MSNSLISSTLWDALYSWVTSVLPGVEVIESHENAPSPEGNFLCINYAGSWNLRGSSASRMIPGRDDLPSPRVYVYTGQVEIRDVDGNGENLLMLIESLENQDVAEKFGTNGLSILRVSGPQMMPALQESHWRRESLLTLTMSWSRAYSGSSLSIESVEITQSKISGEISNEQGNVLQSQETINKFIVEKQEAANGT